MWFALIPVGHGIIVVRAVIGVSVLDGGADRFCEGNGRIKVKAIDRRATARPFFALDRGAVEPIGESTAAKIERAKKIILRARSVDGRTRFAVDEKHVVAFAPPTVLILQHRHGHTDKLAAALGLHPNVIPFAVQVLLVFDKGISVRFPFVGPAKIGLRLAKLRMKVQRIGGQRLRERAVIKVEVKRGNFLLPFVGDGEAGVLLKRHKKEAIQGAFIRHREKFGLPDVVVSQAKAEEIA